MGAGTLPADAREVLEQAAAERVEAEGRYEMELAAAIARTERAQSAARRARLALLDTADEVIALRDRAMPELRRGMYADDPMPADGISWSTVEGDRVELPVSDKSAIEWTDATWNPVTGCTKVSAGCDHCYAETFAERFRGVPGHHFERGFDLTLRPERLDQPLRWSRPRRIFVNSMSDLFHEGVPDEYIADVWQVMAQAPQHTFQILTKRHGRMRSWVSRWCEHPKWATPLPNVWLGVSVEDQRWADIRIPALLATPSAVRWISAEPLLGPVDLEFVRYVDNDCGGCSGLLSPKHEPACGTEPGDHWGLDWVVGGGESGPGARPMHPDWARSLRDQCRAAGVPFLFKQWGAHDAIGQRVGKKAAGRELDGRTWDGYPSERSEVTP